MHYKFGKSSIADETIFFLIYTTAEITHFRCVKVKQQLISVLFLNLIYLEFFDCSYVLTMTDNSDIEKLSEILDNEIEITVAGTEIPIGEVCDINLFKNKVVAVVDSNVLMKYLPAFKDLVKIAENKRTNLLFMVPAVVENAELCGKKGSDSLKWIHEFRLEKGANCILLSE